MTKDVSNKKKKRSVEVHHFLPFYRGDSTHIGVRHTAEPAQRRGRTAGPWCSAVQWISTPTPSRNLPLVVYDRYVFKYFTLF